MTTPLPNWVIDLVRAVETYEFEHGHTGDGWPCLGNALAEVPDDIRDQARAIHEYQYQRGETTRPANTKEN